jgi:hypothetical protein
MIRNDDEFRQPIELSELIYRAIHLALLSLGVAAAVCLGAVGCATSERDAELRRDPQPLGDGWPKYCSVHGKRLREDVVPIGYGLPHELVAPKLREARRSQFPNAATYAWGGCCIDVGEPQPSRSHVLYCPDCRTAREQFYASAAPEE